MQLGAYVHGAPWDLAALDRFETSIGRGLDLLMWYQDFAQTAVLDLDMVGRVAARGTLPMVTWDPWDHRDGARQPRFALATILAGTHDALIGSWAVGLREYGDPVWL